ncbi:alpha/beta hydrolase family protein [Roseibium sp.]|uniref:alpha/beta hydrolase family protein n=1 Tax=Roseibium sp. TaxID=1936156 RepID=UPI003D11DBAE
MKAKKALAWGVAVALVVLGCLFLAFQGLQDFDFSEYRTRPLAFDFDGYSVAGTLHLPRAENPPLVLLVHGDGPADRYSGDGYMPLISTLLDSGIAVYSWDKPGIGESGGNWLSFSMDDRARLAATALATVKQQPGLQTSPAGFLGFSQAGWVLPILAQEPARGDFFVIVGGAINWLRQGAYYTKRKMELAGASGQDIKAALKAGMDADLKLRPQSFSYQDYLASGMDETPMSEPRFGFVQRNMRADSTHNLWHISAPVLTIHGSEDLNVDPVANSNGYREILKGRHKANRSVVVPGGTHALLRAGLFNYQLEGNMPAGLKTLFAVLGRRAYAPGALETLTGWVNGLATENSGAGKPSGRSN